ncbi:MAG TPA: acetate--CoA ligase [Tepidisphaeraceae bacterium]|jgi:acetyl-CoA synthetase|nr:acetate--CoA ligase [Tepidisphaeraceae bacterium]
MSDTSSGAIESTLQEARLFPPPAEFSAAANVKSMDEYRAKYRESIDQPEKFWSGMAQALHWFKPWDKVLDWKAPYAKWFVGGKLNAAYNCLDAQITAGRGGKTAILWEGELETGSPGSGGAVRRITFSELKDQVCQAANALKSLGVKKGDRVTIYMPMVPEAAITMLACARIGAPHSVIFGGFSSQAIADRVEDAQSEIIITADGGFRRGTVVPLKANVDDALKKTRRVKKVVVLQHVGQTPGKDLKINWTEGRDIWWHDLVNKQSTDCPAEPMDADDALYILYTSGSTGKPKGIQHATGGYMVGVNCTSKYVFDLKDNDIFWCSADIGWVTGHSYVVYGLLSNGTTTLMYEGAPNYPDFSRFWAMIQRHKVTVLYTAPTAIRAFMRAGRELADKHDLKSLRLLGSVGEPINPEAWMWYREVIGGNRCPIVDTWWQTETGMIMITPLPGATPTKPGTATLPFFGVDAAIVDRSGKEMGPNQGGLLVVRKPWPAMLRGIFNDPDRYVKQYWSDVAGVYFTGDGARRDNDGYFWIMGRVDDVINVSGHRLGTMEIESALVAHPAVAEAAVVGMPHEMKGQGIACFVTLEASKKPSEELKKELMAWVAKQIGALARPDQIRFTDSLPKTRSGKIMRRLLKEVAAGGEVKGDTTTLEDFTVLAKLKEKDEG